MALKTQKAVMANLDRMNGTRMQRAAKAYRKETIGPMLEALETAGDGQEALQHLNAGLLRRMDSAALEEAVADDAVQSAIIGRASALPKGT